MLFQTGSKRGGFFVEFGATDGVTLSNTWLLETDYAWNGILAEPARGWHQMIAANRKCIIDQRCVTGRSGEVVSFRETPWREVSTIESYSAGDHHSASRKTGEVYDVTTISLNDLLDQHAAPAEIDYLSVDTEGSELEILQAFDFARYRPAILTVEHNHVVEHRDGIHALLTGQGYARIFTEFSQFDDWYVRQG